MGYTYKWRSIISEKNTNDIILTLKLKEVFKMDKQLFKKCDECGSLQMKKETKNLSFNFRGKKLTLESIDIFKCPDCSNEVVCAGEMEMIENLIEYTKDKEIDILNLEETADLLRVSNQTIYNMIRDGRIKAYKVGREWRFMRADIQAYLNQGVSSLLAAAKGGKIDKDDLKTMMETIEEEEDE